MTWHFIPTRIDDENRYQSEAIVRVKGATRQGGPGGWFVSGWSADGEGRLVFQGPMVQGPHASLVGRCAVMDNHGGTKAQWERAAEAGLLFDVDPGDVLVIAGVEYVLSLSPWKYPKLNPLNKTAPSLVR